MMCYVHYISALMRLHESEKTVIMLGGEREAPATVKAQRDFIKMEKEYFSEECITMNFILIALSAFTGMCYVIYLIKA